MPYLQNTNKPFRIGSFEIVDSNSKRVFLSISGCFHVQNNSHIRWYTFTFEEQNIQEKLLQHFGKQQHAIFWSPDYTD